MRLYSMRILYLFYLNYILITIQKIPNKSLKFFTLVEYCSKLNNRDTSMVQMYWTQTKIAIKSSICYNK